MIIKAYNEKHNYLLFIDLEIGPHKEEEVVLVFEINPDDLTSGVFTASRDDMLYEVKLK